MQTQLQAAQPLAAARPAAAAGSAARPVAALPLRQPRGGSSQRQGHRALHVAAAQGPQEKRSAIQQQRLDTLARIDDLFDEEIRELESNLVTELVADDWKEQDRKKLRAVFDFERWQRHRSSNRYFRHMAGLVSSRTLKWMGAPLAYVATVAVGVALYHTAAEYGLVPEVIPEIKNNTIFNLTNFALANLLVLTTNTAYQRFDEARKMWGLIVNRSRDMTRQALGYIPDSQPELQEMFCRWVVAYGRSLQCHLRAGENLERELLGKLPPKELQALLNATHRPNFCKQVLAEILRRAQLPGALPPNTLSTANVKASAFVRMDEHLTVFADVTGGCERILRTPVPLAYSRHTSRALTIWLTFMPFSLWDNCGWYTVPATLLVAFLLLGIKEIGLTVEEPFSILPLERICDTIEGNVWELHSAHSAEAAGAARAKRGQGNAQSSMDAEDLVGMAMTGQLA
ncbi:hypothetical protein ABPG75_009238 [Micractinium tetrahymenae]